MLRFALLGLGLCALLASNWAQAQPATGSIRVQVNGHREVHGDGKPPGQVAVTNIETRDDKIVDLTLGGRADIGNLPDGNYIVTVHSGDRTGTTYVRVVNGRQTTAEMSAGGLPTSRTFTTSPSTLAGEGRAAIDKCDREAYDRAALELARDEAMLEVNLRDLRAIGASTLPTQRQVEGRLNAVKAARQQLPPYPQPCGKTAAAPATPEQVAVVQFLLNPELALIFANRPQFLPFRLEVAGIITKLGAFKPDDTDTGTKIGMSAGMRWDSSMLGTKQLGIEAKVWYVDYNMTSEGDVVADPGGTIGLFSPATQAVPFGGYFTAGPLSHGRYDADVQSYGGEVQVQTWVSSGNFRAMPWFGVRVGRTTVDEKMNFDIGMPVFTTFEQKNDIKDTYIGPTIGLKARLDISGGLYGFAEGSVALEYHRGKGDWQTFVPAADAVDGPRKEKLSSSKWGISASLKAGLGFEVGGFGMQFGAGVNYTNASPYLEYKEADSTTTGTGGGDIGYGSQRDYFMELRGTVKF